MAAWVRGLLVGRTTPTWLANCRRQRRGRASHRGHRSHRGALFGVKMVARRCAPCRGALPVNRATGVTGTLGASYNSALGTKSSLPPADGHRWRKTTATSPPWACEPRAFYASTPFAAICGSDGHISRVWAGVHEVTGSAGSSRPQGGGGGSRLRGSVSATGTPESVIPRLCRRAEFPRVAVSTLAGHRR